MMMPVAFTKAHSVFGVHSMVFAHSRVSPLLVCGMVVLRTVAAGHPASAQTTSTWDGSTGNWTDALRWSTNPNFPNDGNGGVNYTAVINAGSVTLNQAIGVTGFTMGGGTLAGPSVGGPFTLTAAGTINLNSGTLAAGVTVRNNGTANINGNYNVNGLFINAGTVANGGTGGSSSGTITNLAGATYNLVSLQNLQGSLAFENFGTFAFVPVGGTGNSSYIFGPFNNHSGATVGVGNGSFNFLGGGVHDGSFVLNGNAGINFGGTQTFNPSSSISGTGGITFYGPVTYAGTYTPTGVTDVAGTVTFNGAYGGNGKLYVEAGGTVNLNQPTTLTTIDMRGTLAGTGAITLNGTDSGSGPNSFAFGGTLGGTAAAATRNIGSFGIGGGSVTIFAHNFNNAAGATLVWNGTGGITLNSGITLTNAAGATTTANMPSTMAGTGVFDNYGTFTKLSDTGLINVNATFNNQPGATVNVQTGTLTFANPGVLAGTFSVSPGATLAFAGTETLPGAATFAGSGTLGVTGGAATLSGPLTFPNFSLSGGTLTGPGNISAGSLTISGGTLATSGTLTVSTLTLAGGTLGRNLVVNGTTANVFNAGTLAIGPGFALTIPAGVTLQAQTGTIAGPGTVVNQGTIAKSGTGTVTITAPFTNAAGAQVQVQAGTLSLGGGSLDGSYSISSGATLNLTTGASVLSSAVISGAGQLTASGAAAIAAGGANSYSGGTTVVSGGNLLVTGSGPALGTGPVGVASGGILRLSAPNNVAAGVQVAVPAGAVLGLESSFDPTPIVPPTAAGVIAVDAVSFSTPLNLAAIGNGSIFLGSAGSGNYTATTLGAGSGNTYRLGGGGGTLTLGGTNLLTGPASVTVGGTGLTGTVRITAANDYTVGTTLAGATLAVGNAGALGTGPLTITGGTIQADGGPTAIANPVVIGGTATVGGADVLTLSGPVTLTGSRTITVNAPGGLAITGPVGEDAPGRVLVKNGTGTLTLSATNSYSGGTTVSAGTLQTVGASQALGLGNVTVQAAVLRQAAFGNLAAGATVNVLLAGVLGLDGDFPPSLSSSAAGVLAIDIPTYSQVLNEATQGNGQMSLGAIGAGQYNAATLGSGSGNTYRLGGGGGTLTIPTANLLTGFNGLIVGSSRTNGTGTVVLAADQNYQGGTTVAGGTLLVDGTLGTGGAVTVQTGAVLGGSGVVNRPVTVQPGGTVSALGNNFTVASLTGSAGAVVSNNAAADGTITVGTDNTSATFGGTIADGTGGRLGLVKVGTGTLTLTNVNSYSGGTTIAGGTLAVSRDAALGAGNVTGTAVSTLSFTGTTTTARTIALSGGSMTAAAGQTVTFNGGTAAGLTVDGPGQFATDPTNGGRFVNITTAPAASLTSNSPNDVFRHFANGGTLAVAPGVNSTGTSPAIHLDGFTTQGLGSVTIGAGSRTNVANFQSYGTLTLAAGANSGLATRLTNLGSSPLGFNAGSRTFIGTPQTAGQNLALVDLHGQNAVVAGGLFVNNGFVGDSSNRGATIVADYGALVKGAGTFQSAVITQNGGKFQAGNSPGVASFGRFVFGPGGVDNYVFAIDDAAGTAGPAPDTLGHVSGWSLVRAVDLGTDGRRDGGAFVWTATPADKLTVAIETLVNPTAVGVDVPGSMDHFDPTRSYVWPAVSWAGTYSGPADAATLAAATAFDTNGFLNPVDGSFGWSLDAGGHGLSLTYTPSAVPEPGALLLTAFAVVIPAVRRARPRRT
jgi:fibronectin-binding autotransporter adhesin